MVRLALGVLLWSATHFFRGLAPQAREALISRVGLDRYKGLFSLSIVASVALIVSGWRGSSPELVYLPPYWGRSAALGLMLVALVLFAASGVPTNIKRVLRHPQLCGVATWSFAHLLANGDTRSVVLFSGIGLWALLQMLLINRREGAWVKPPPVPLAAEIKPLVGGLVGYLVLFFAHPYFSGVSPVGM